MGYGVGVGAWVGYKRPSHHPGWAWVSAWPLGWGFQPGRWAGLAVFRGRLSLAGLARLWVTRN
ncbi:hypothetical protein HanIR_Chr09g0416841 [Helianthus annuus]|nr:hypothetical protein HanIR_Chr09g0416841 [Helianthus annuus]